VANKPISVTIKGDYSDKDIKRAMRDLDSLRKQGPKTSQALRNVGKGFAIAGAAALGAAAYIGVNAVKAAAAEEEAVAKLNKTLGNLGLAHEEANVAQFIDDLQFATGVADDDLRPAYGRLVSAVGDAGKAMDATRLAMDIAAGTGKSLESVSLALSKAYTGNAGSLTRLGVPLDKALIKSGDMVAITRELSRVFKGQAAAAANTLAGRVRILDIAVQELNESLGKGLAEGFLTGTEGTEEATRRLREMQDGAETLGIVLGGLGSTLLAQVDPFILGAMKVADAWDDAWAAIERVDINVKDFWGEISDEEGQRRRDQLDAADAEREAGMFAFWGRNRVVPPTPTDTSSVGSSVGRARGGSPQTVNYNFGGIYVDTPAEAVEQAKRLTRLRGLGNRGAQAALAAS
jgi:hypothetical protein